MGGYGSGLPIGGSSKDTVDESKTVDIDWLRRQKSSSGTLTWSRGEVQTGSISYVLTNEDLRLIYTVTDRQTDEKTDVNETISLQTTNPHFGGKRYWMMCPRCQRRVKTLHKPPGAIYFRCRICYDLTYQSCRESHKYDRLYALVARNLGADVEDVKRSLKTLDNLDVDMEEKLFI